MRTYASLLRQRGVAAPFASALVGRLTPGMVALAIVLLVRSTGASYAAAGALTAAHSVGVGIGSPLLGRLVDRVGLRPVLVPSSLAYGAAMTVFALAVAGGWSLLPLLALGVVAGASLPPVSPVARVLWGVLFRHDHDRREAAYALDSVSVEIGFLVGPLLTIVVVGLAGEVAAVIVTGAASALGGVAFALTHGATLIVPDVGGRPHGGALRSRGVVTLVLGFLFASLTFGVLEVAIPAIAETSGNTDAAGPIFAALAGGSLLGGLVYGARRWPGTLLQRFGVLGVAFAGGMMLLPVASGLVWTGVAMFVAGLTLAPSVICAYQLLDDLSLQGTTTEAMTWAGSANVAGTAAGAALAGLAVDSSGTTLALAVGSGGVVLAGLVMLVRRATLTAPGEPAVAPRTVSV